MPVGRSLVIALLVVAGGCSVARQGHPSAARGSPAAAASASAPATSSSSVTPIPATNPPPACSAKGLRADESGSNGLAGNVEYIVALTNVASFPCHLGGYPVGLVVRSGGNGQVRVSDGEPWFPVHPVTVRPGQFGVLLVISPKSCDGTSQPAQSVDVALRDGVIPIHVGTGPNVGLLAFPCGLAMLSEMGNAGPQ